MAHLPESFLSRPRPLVLAILDGWGHAEGKGADHNALLKAHTPNLDALSTLYPWSLLDASEHAVGLPEGQMGNSEVGHMNIGSGRVVLQDLPRIDKAIADGKLAAHPRLRAMIQDLKASGKACHILGLLSPGGVHSHQDHIAALANIVASEGIKVWIHAFFDGRDTPPKSAMEYLGKFRKDTAGYDTIRFGTVGGRYFAMDRDKRWERAERAYRAMVRDGGDWAAGELQPVATAYSMNITDEFVPPCAIGEFKQMEDGDALICTNFRADRVRQILTALLDPEFDGFERTRVVKFSHAIGMVEYSKKLNPHISALFPPEILHDILGEVVSKAGLTQLRIAETEKYAHVTFFFNSGREEMFPGEERILVPSPKVATYDLKPEMSAPEVTDKLVEAIGQERFDVIVVNYANTDMVGHSGDMAAACKAVEAVDACIGRLWKAVKEKNGALILTADHGNIEQMFDDQSGQPHTAHTLNRVPFTIMAGGFERGNAFLRDGKLADIAPTMLQLLGLEQPIAMTGKSLIA